MEKKHKDDFVLLESWINVNLMKELNQSHLFWYVDILLQLSYSLHTMVALTFFRRQQMAQAHMVHKRKQFHRW